MRFDNELWSSDIQYQVFAKAAELGYVWPWMRTRSVTHDLMKDRQATSLQDFADDREDGVW
jgi:hypothetical protein